MAKYGFYKKYNGCSIHNQPSCYAATNEHGLTIGCSQTLGGIESVIDNYQITKDHSGVILRATAEKMSEEGIQKIAIATLTHKGFTSYIYQDFNGTFEELNCNTYYNGKIIDFVANPDYVVGHQYKLNLELYTKYVKKQLKVKLFKLGELTKLKSYDDFKNKLDFVWNILPQTFESKTIFHIGNDNYSPYPYRALTHTFKNKDDAILCDRLNKEVQALHFEKMEKDDAYLESACIYEFYNHESPIDWDGRDPALESIGLSEKKIANDKRKLAIVNRAYKKVCSAHCW